MGSRQVKPVQTNAVAGRSVFFSLSRSGRPCSPVGMANTSERVSSVAATSCCQRVMASSSPRRMITRLGLSYSSNASQQRGTGVGHAFQRAPAALERFSPRRPGSPAGRPGVPAAAGARAATTVAGGQRVVREVLAPLQQGLVVVGGEKETAGLTDRKTAPAGYRPVAWQTPATCLTTCRTAGG